MTIKKQPKPKKTTGPAIWDLVVDDMKARDRMGLKKYGMRLQAQNGRDSLQDSYEEILDLIVYFKTYLIEDQ